MEVSNISLVVLIFDESLFLIGVMVEMPKIQKIQLSIKWEMGRKRESVNINKFS